LLCYFFYFGHALFYLLDLLFCLSIDLQNFQLLVGGLEHAETDGLLVGLFGWRLVLFVRRGKLNAHVSELFVAVGKLCAY
jgi:hypothetical protein